MKVLMIGWDYPPEITGGIGTACHWLNKALLDKGIDLKIISASPKSRNYAHSTDLDYFTNTESKTIKLADAEFEKLTTAYYEQTKIVTNINSPYFSIPHANLNDAYSKSKLLEKVMSFDSPELHKTLLRYSRKVIDSVKNEHFDIIHAHDWPTFQAAKMVGDLTNTPVLLHIHSTELDRMTIFANTAILEIEKIGFLEANHLVTVSEFTKKMLVDFYGVDPNKVTVVYNGVPEGFNQIQPSPNLPKFNEKVVTFIGRITQQKGPGYFVNAAFKLVERFPNVRFIMAGDGNQREEMIEMVAALGISKKFHFPGFLSIDEVKDVFSLSDLIVMPSVSEPFGLVAVEALSAGVPVIVSRESGVSEILPNINQVDYWETEKLADSMQKCLEHPALAKRRVFESQKDLKEYTWEKVANRIIEVYQDMFPV